MIDLAAEWAGVGLVARSFWLSHATVIEANSNDGVPLAKATVIGPAGNEHHTEEVELAHALASKEHLSDLRVLWLRNPGDASGMAEAMTRAEDSIRRLIPQHGVEPMFAEIIVPETLRDLEIPMPPPDWQQYVVEPRDRPSPTASDSYWDQTTPARQGLHAALMIGGILGGTHLGQPAPCDANTSAPWIVHPFTRAVRGADRARQVAHSTLHRRLETMSAADVAPERYIAPEPSEASDYIEDTRRWVLDLDNEALRFRRPVIRLERRGQSFSEFLIEVVHFLGWVLKRLFGLQRWRDLGLVLRALIARRLEADDYGATLDPHGSTPRELDLKDYDALEAAAQEEAAARITLAARADGRLPDRMVWESVATLVPSLTDGSAGPRTWKPRERFGRTFVIPPQALLRIEPEVLDSAASGAGGSPALDELRGVRRVGEQELARAGELADIGLREHLARFESPTGRVTMTAQAITEQAQAEDAAQRREFARSLREVIPRAPDGELPLLSRLRASVVSDLLLARFSAEHLGSMTRTALPNALPQLQRMLRDGTWVVLGTVLVGIGLTLFVTRFAQEIDALFAVMQAPYPTSWTQIVSWVISAAIGVLLFVFARLFYAYHAYNEVGRRRLEYVERRAAAAAFAYEERNRLRNADRILSAWEDILSSIGTRNGVTHQRTAAVPDDLPDALQVAEPDFDDDDLAKLVIHDTIEPGWIGTALDGLKRHVLSKDDEEQIWTDPAMVGGPLARLQAAAIGGSFQREWWDDWIGRAGDALVEILSAETNLVLPVATRLPTMVTAKEFHTEITQSISPEYRPGTDYEELFDARDKGHRLHAMGRPWTTNYLLTPALTALDSVLIYRRLGRITDHQDGDADAHGDSDIGRA